MFDKPSGGQVHESNTANSIKPDLHDAIQQINDFNRSLSDLVADAIKQIDGKTKEGINGITATEGRALVLIADARNSAIAAINAAKATPGPSRKAENPSGKSLRGGGPVPTEE